MGIEELKKFSDPFEGKYRITQVTFYQDKYGIWGFKKEYIFKTEVIKGKESEA